MITEAVGAAIENKLTNLQPKQATEFLTRKQTADLLGISLPTLSDWTFSGKLKGYRIGSRIRYKRHEIEAALLTINKRG